jgi:hypothetical protein
MGLDLSQTAAQLGGVTSGLKSRRSAKAEAVVQARRLLKETDAQVIEERRNAGKFSWRSVAALSPDAAAVHDAPPLPADYAVAAVDGSHIDVDRHAPAPCYLINIGYVALRYGELAEARLWNTPKLYSSDDDMIIADPTSALNAEPIEGQVLGVKRAVDEMTALADVVESLPEDLPVLALLDGSLTLVGLTGQNPPYVWEALLNNGLLPALDRLHKLAERRTLAVASYISLPRSEQVVTTLRLQACPFAQVNCLHECNNEQRGKRACDIVGGITDTDLFADLLAPGQRSQTYRSLAKVMDEYGEHRVHFFYVNVGQELARVEMPEWTALSPEAVGFAHAAVLAQADKGHGYPVALSEAHEQAVVTGRDRENFATLLGEAMAAQKLPVTTSEKARSKRARFV